MRRTLPAIFLLVIAIGAGFYFVREPLQTRLRQREAALYRAQNPPEEIVFVPQSNPTSPPATLQPTPTLIANTPVATNAPSTPAEPIIETAAISTTTPVPDGTPSPATLPPPPAQAWIEGVKYQSQHGFWNYCGPANLAMAISFAGTQTDRTDAGAFMRGGLERVDDKNVSPDEMVRYVDEQTDQKMVLRYGGDLDLLKRLIAASYPVIIEEGYELEGEGWLGHYLLLNGYDNAVQEFVAQDTYLGADSRYPYEVIAESWRAFNYAFLVTLAPEQEEEVMELLGDWASAENSLQIAYEKAVVESAETTNLQLFFAQFNLGSTLTLQQNHTAAAEAFDTAFQTYAQLPADTRPWRTLWYRFTPFEAYFTVGRYQDVINLADTTLTTLADPILEESYYWRGRAKAALNNPTGARTDLETALRLNSNFLPAQRALDQLP